MIWNDFCKLYASQNWIDCDDIAELDNTKDFHLQDDKVIQAILDFLTKE